MIKLKKKIRSLFGQYKKETLMVLTVIVFVFDILTEIPYVNLAIQNIFVKLLFVWLLSIAVFKVSYVFQTKVILGLLFLMPFFVFMNFQSYDHFGMVIYLLILAATYSATVSENKLP